MTSYNNNNDSETSASINQAPGPQVVDQYWDEIAEHLHELGFSTFDKGKSSQAVVKDPEFRRKMLLAVITDHLGQGDTLPSVIAKSCRDFLTSLDQTGKKDFLRLPASDFGGLQEDVAKATEQYATSANIQPETNSPIVRETIAPPCNHPRPQQIL
ncbi:hypothetical protein BGZ49_002053 [Haplosporangium sp. Z 27]|nr:hypothetical protein BGZ49_002053 [Haplosporangium sp. Z 27]